MEIDYSKRKHESPFDDAPPKDSPFATDLPQAESPSKDKTPTISQPKISGVHGSSEKAQFRVFIGAFFLIAAFPAAYWANYTFREYQYNAAVLQRWREHPEEIRTTLKPADEIYIQSTIVQNKLLEASLFGAGSLLCFLIAAYLFFRTFKIYRRVKYVEYEEIDWRSFNKPSSPIEVLYGRTNSVAAVLFYVFFGGLTLLAVLTNIKPDGIRFTGVVIGLLNSSLIGVMYFLLNNGKKKSIKSFDASGITRGDGRHFLWSDFRGANPRIGTFLYGGKMIWRTELIFVNGVVWLIPQRIKNYDEVYDFVDALPRAVLKEAV